MGAELLSTYAHPRRYRKLRRPAIPLTTTFTLSYIRKSLRKLDKLDVPSFVYRKAKSDTMTGTASDNLSR